MIPDAQVWTVIVVLAFGSFGLRFLFLGLVGDRSLSPTLLRHLRYTAVAVLPALIAPLVVWPAATGGAPDAARLIAAVATLTVGYLTRSLLWGIAGGAGALYLAGVVLGGG